MGSWWLLREIELSTLRARLVTQARGDGGQRQAFITLPASKSDQAAHGIARGHRCHCIDGGPRQSCPVHVLRDQALFLRRQFPHRFLEGVPDWNLPLFPSLGGETCEKPAMVRTILEGAHQLGIPPADPEGTTRISGHSLRVGGAQGLTRLGFPLWAVQLLGRWGAVQ